MSIGSVGYSDALWVSPKKAEAILDIGHTRLYQLINAGELETTKEGASTKITVASIHAYYQRQIEKARNAA
jgi:hypothetical protein